MTNWYETFFQGPYRDLYGPLLGPEITDRQVEAVWHWLGLQPGERVLDLPCGHGRHAVRLAARGVQVTGQDLDAASLEQAAAAAAAAGVSAEWRQGDMRQIAERDHFDAVINLFSSFGYFAEDEDNVAVLQAVAQALKPGGRFLIDLNNRDGGLLGGYEQRTWEQQADGRILVEERHYDPYSGRMRIRLGWGTGELTEQWLRLYTLPELVHLLRGVGLAVTGVWGDYGGGEYDLAAPRLIVRAVKPDV